MNNIKFYSSLKPIVLAKNSMYYLIVFMIFLPFDISHMQLRGYLQLLSIPEHSAYIFLYRMDICFRMGIPAAYLTD